ncbi:SDR family NAD(P)-dependent oxidoreductase [Helicobacter kayseriensis]|uniref:SDR family NAD(P)-dependent oxidoreductase n=1 Tax=Helicobacter kayseriensis TaxID=2905877 RepID=UPI001E61DFB8|nr:SDR family NAD(P)-dependent oxidoreductase [Helicobacter kayseriensis]MCE3047593.1 SDR family NAD(P)-dependent oxidoreductase [Helicobacter kayseriensis]MCE3048964.1 SDR family NAD(P)-dependent oxidoreductase [Helicobacter kayseriensis]
MLALITGASSGIGEAIAKRFIQEKHQVILLARRKDRLEKLQSLLGSNCLEIIDCDLRNIQEVQARLQSFLSKIDVLINNAGLALGLEPFYKSPKQNYQEMIETNILALVELTHFILPSMIANQKGHIINIGSIAGNYPYPGSNIYGATKAFIKQFSLNLRADLIDQNIRITNIEPSLVGGSEFSLVRFNGDEQKAKEVYANTTPLMPEDIAESVFWCASLPSHININRLELMPTTQAFSPLRVIKNPT